jgi:CBS domain-containing protein
LADRASATPLLALDAVVFDTETTGLDPTHARLIEIGAIRLAAGRVAADERFHTLVDPGVPIPPASTRIHGIDESRIKGRTGFRQSLAGIQILSRRRGRDRSHHRV